MAILTIFIIFTLIQISYWFFFYVKFSSISTKSSTDSTFDSPVSIVICFKNEAINIREHLDSWIAQLAPKDELILVDDFSTDDALEYITKRTQNRPNVHLIKASMDRPGKKQALTDGVSLAKSEFILVTDADCRPPLHWKNRMCEYIDAQTDFVLGFAPFDKKNTFLNVFQRFEVALTALQYFTYAASGHPYMGVGRNMLFSRRIFSSDIYENPDLASGDDDLLVSARASNENTRLCIDPASFVYSEAEDDVRAFIRQKSRHVSSSLSYQPKHKFFLGLFSTSQILSNFLFLCLLFTFFWWIALMTYAVKVVLMTITLYYAGQKLKEKDLYQYAVILDLTLSFYYLLLSIRTLFNNKAQWN